MSSLDRVDHIVVLMLENRSFDHMLGYLKPEQPRVDGLRGDETIPSAPGDPASHPVRVSATALPENPGPDPGHELGDVREQLYGAPGGDFPRAGSMNGFVANYRRRAPTADAADAIMACFAPQHIPVLATLARQFGLCDGWFSSLPGPTWPNRVFVHAATSAGHADNGFRVYSVPTIYQRLESAKRTWCIYYHDIPQTLVFPHVAEHFHPFSKKVRLFDDFAGDVARRRLADYVFIEPRYFDAPERVDGDRPLPPLWANDQHPNHDVRRGEHLIADVYETLRASRLWEKTLLFFLYDEHGGFYDHVFPAPAVVPDDAPSSSGFPFDRLGVRVPAVVVSPWVEAGTLDHDAQDRPVVRDHTSVLATVETRFGLEPLTARDAAAADVAALLTRTAPRVTETEAPTRLSRPSLDDAALVASLRTRAPRRRAAARPLTDFQNNLLHLIGHVSLAKETGTTKALARSRVGPTVATAAPHLSHAARLAARPARVKRPSGPGKRGTGTRDVPCSRPTTKKPTTRGTPPRARAARQGKVKR
jgi:phospholipase C